MSSGVETRVSYKNGILASLPKAEIARLAPHLSFLDLPVNQTLQEPNVEVTHAYFLESGMASVVVEMADGNTVETGITGKEGLVGFSILLGTNSMPTRTFMQIPGTGYKIKAKRLKEEFENSGTLRKRTNSYIQGHLMQTGQTAACNRLHDIAERLARWLLMCHDRMESDNFSITHEFLGHMLGTPRSTVTVAAGILHKTGLVEYSRGKINVCDRQGLEKAACECYWTIRKEFDRLGISSAG
jgi:CRP-like cAMP-binding protein